MQREKTKQTGNIEIKYFLPPPLRKKLTYSSASRSCCLYLLRDGGSVEENTSCQHLGQNAAGGPHVDGACGRTGTN